jgi:CPA1 family monovalent cation:H+ antiporter
LAVIIEGESLFNDGTAIVVYNIVLVFVLTGAFDLFTGIADFVRVSLGGVVVGLILGYIIARLIARVDDYLIETTLTTVLAFGSYLVAEQLHFSGVLAVVTAGLINGNIGPQGMSPTTRIVLFNFWEYVAFLANSMIFLMIGLQVNIPVLLENWQLILWAILAVIAARVLVVYGLGGIANRWIEPISLRWKHVMAWGGLRGAISLALALSLPTALGPDRDLLRTMAFGVVLFTLLVPATTMSRLIRKLKIVTRSEVQMTYELRHARLTALRAAEAHLERRHREGLISHHAWEVLKPRIMEQITYLVEAVREVMSAEPSLQEEELDTARREALRAQRSAYLGLRQDGVISDEAFEKLVAEVDTVLDQDEASFWLVTRESLPQRLREGAGKDVEVAEFILDERSPIVGRKVGEVKWPPDCIIASLRRNYKVIVPSGETMLLGDDILVVVANATGLEAVRRICQGSDTASITSQ